MNKDQREIQRKLRILRYADEIGHVAKACRYFGIGRASFYRWRAAYQKHGENGLINRPSIPKQHYNHYRDRNSAEVDLVLEFSPTRRWAIEIKSGTNPNPRSGSVTASETMQVERRILVHKGPEEYQAKGEFEAMPLREALEAVAEA